MQVAVEFDYTFETEAGSTVSRCAILESLDVILNGRNFKTALLGSLLQEYGVVNTLSTGSDLLTSHEEVVRVGEALVSWVQHSVEGSSSDGVAVKHVEVSVVFLAHHLTESLLSLSSQVLELTLLEASFLEHLDTLTEVNFHDRVSTLEFFEGVLIVDD